MRWLKKHPRLYAIGGVLVVIGGGLAAFAGIWSLFSPEPFIPFIVTRVAFTSPLWIRWVVTLVFVCLTIFGIIILITIFRQTRIPKSLTLSDGTHKIAEGGEAVIQVTNIYEDNRRECGLNFKNTSLSNLTDCHARLLDLAFEIPHSRYSLERYPKAEDLVCTENVAGLGAGKIPLFRWGWDPASKDLEIVYKNETQSIGYGILNVPILVLLNVWADNVQNTYAICKLEDRLGWGYSLSILKTGILQGDVKLTTYQKPSLGIEGTDY